MNDTSTLSAKERLISLEHELSQAESLEMAEHAFRASNPEGKNPWEGAARKLAALKADKQDLELRLRGHELSSALEKLKTLDAELAKAEVARDLADAKLRELNSNETVVRYKAGTMLSIQYGWGWSYERFRQWYETGQARSFMPQDAVWFVDSPDCPAALKFNLESDRQTIRRWVEAKGTSDQALVHWNAIASQRAALLRERPELKDVG